MFITLCNNAALRGIRSDGREVFSLFFFSAHHTPTPLEDYSKGQSKSEQAAVRKPIYLLWFMGYCTD